MNRTNNRTSYATQESEMNRGTLSTIGGSLILACIAFGVIYALVRVLL